MSSPVTLIDLFSYFCTKIKFSLFFQSPTDSPDDLTKDDIVRFSEIHHVHTTVGRQMLAIKLFLLLYLTGSPKDCHMMLSATWGVFNSGSIHMDRSTSARHVDRSTVGRAGAIHKKTKMADFHRPIVCQLIKRTLSD